MRRILAAAVICLFTWPALAQNLFAAPTQPGSIQLNLVPGDMFGATMNFEKMAGSQSFASGGLSTQLNSDGYPIGPTLTGTISQSIFFVPYDTTTQWVLRWAGQGGYQLNKATNIVSDAQNCDPGHTANTGILGIGTNCRIVFTWGVTATGALSVDFPTAATYSGMSNLILCRASDEASVLAGGVWTPEFLSSLNALNVLSLRTMELVFSGNSNYTNYAKWKNRTPLTGVSWQNSTWPPGLWGGTASGTDQYTSGAAPDTPAVWTDGEEIQLQFTNANVAALTVSGAANNGSGAIRLTVSATATLSTNQLVGIVGIVGTVEANGPQTITVIDGTHIDLQSSTFTNNYSSGGSVVTTTINVNSRGAVPVVSNFIGAPTIAAGSTQTLYYDGLLGLAIVNAGGLISDIPIEAQVNLANSIAKPLWYVLPPYIDNASVTSLTQYVSANLSSSLYLQYCNECWNFSFPQASWMNARGVVLGLPISSNNALYSAYGLRHRQLMTSVVWSRPSGTLIRLLGAQEHGTPSQFDTYAFSGNTLTGTGNAAYQAKVGVNYNASPNRPIDFADAITVATYYIGSQTSSVASNSFYGGLTFANITGMIVAGANFALGDNTNVQNALAFVDNDTRAGTLSTIAVGSIAGTAMNISSVSAGTFAPGSYIIGTGVLPNTTIVSGSGTTGNYTIAPSQNISSEQLVGSGTGTVGSATLATLATTYPGWSVVAQEYTNPNTGLQIVIYGYEGGESGVAPTAAWLASQGDGNSVVNAANFAALIAAYRSSGLAYQTVRDQCNQFLAFTRVKGCSWFTIAGPNNQWSLLQNGYFPAAPYATYSGVQAKNLYPYLLNRDLDPASNDNSPAFLDKAV